MFAKKKLETISKFFVQMVWENTLFMNLMGFEKKCEILCKLITSYNL